MKKILIPIIISILVAFIAYKSMDDNSNNGKCCEACTKKDEVKYYSIDTKYDRCGECCLNPKVFFIFKFFEKGLTLAENTTCESLGYSSYEETESHGVFPIKVTLDKYKKPE